MELCFGGDYQSFFQSNFCYHDHFLNSPCLRSHNISASVIRGMLNIASLNFFPVEFWLLRIKWFSNLIAYLGGRQCNPLKRLLLVCPQLCKCHSLHTESGSQQQSWCTCCLRCVCVCVCLWMSWHLWIIQDGTTFSKVKIVFYFFRLTIHLFRKQQLSAPVVINVSAEKIQDILWLSFNDHKCLGFSKAYINTSGPPIRRW